MKELLQMPEGENMARQNIEKPYYRAGDLFSSNIDNDSRIGQKGIMRNEFRRKRI